MSLIRLNNAKKRSTGRGSFRGKSLKRSSWWPLSIKVQIFAFIVQLFANICTLAGIAQKRLHNSVLCCNISPTMLKDERQDKILEKLSADNKVSLVALSQELDVSYDSIRRDVIELEERGMLKKVHGGAIANSYLARQVRQVMGTPNAEISMIARKARSLFSDGQIILMDGGGDQSIHCRTIAPYP